MDFKQAAIRFKAISDETRLKIVAMLADNELCACQILEAFHFTQPTLSYHMKILTESELVTGNKVGSWIHYTLNDAAWQELLRFMDQLPAYPENLTCLTCLNKPCP